MTKVVTVVLKADTKGAQKEVTEFNDDLKETQSDLSGVENVADRATKGMIGGFRGALTSIKGVIKGFKTMKLAIISTGIGALVVVLGSLAAAFTTSEEGQNKFNKLSTVMSAAIGNLVDLLADLGEKLIEAFEKPQEALNKFGDLLEKNITNRIKGIINILPSWAKIFKHLFAGEFTEAAKVAADAAGMVLWGVENITEKVEDATDAVSDFIEEQTEEMKLAAQVADMRAKADKIERKLLVDRSKLESQIALLRLKARQEDEFSAEERKKALLEAQDLENQLLNQEKEALELRRDAQVQENKFARSNKENLDKEAEAIAAVNNIVARRADTARTLQRELNTINKQIEAENKRLHAEELARQKELSEAEQKRIAEEIKREDAQFNMLQKIRNTAQEQEEFELIQAFDKKMLIAQGNAELEIALQEQLFEDLAAIGDKYRKQETDKDKAAANTRMQLRAQQVQVAADALGAISELVTALAKEDEQSAKKAFKINKALGIAQAIVSTAQGIINAYANPVDVASGIAFAKSAVIATTGAAQVATIARQQFEYGGDTGGNISAPQGVPTATQPQAPQFNIVGDSAFNQIAGALGQPIQAYVVAQDVTTAQQLDNGIITSATLGGG